MRRSLALLLLLGACKPDTRPAPTKESAGDAGATPVVSTGAPDAAAPPQEIPTLVPEKLEPGGRHPKALFPVEGALMVLEGERHVGRIVGDGVEWLTKEISGAPTFAGYRVVQSVSGKWPDAIDVTHTFNGGRIAAPTYVPLTGKGVKQVYGEGGVSADLAGVARVGESTLVVGSTNFEGHSVVTVRGRPLPRRLSSAKQLGCTGDFSSGWGNPQDPDARAALYPRAFEGTPAGTLVSVGMLCGKKPAAEVWDKAGKSRVIELDAVVKGSFPSATLLRGSGDDELWLLLEGNVLHFHDGSFAPITGIGGVQTIAVSDKGVLHAYDGQTLHRHENGAWVPVGSLAWPTSLRRIGVEGGALWAEGEGAVLRLREGKSLGYREPCATPFVYLFDASPKNAKDYTFPTTQKALASFPEVSELGLVEVVEAGARRLGVTVRSKAQGEAVIAHVKATMKDESPRLYCYEPRSPRRIALDAAAKAPGGAH